MTDHSQLRSVKGVGIVDTAVLFGYPTFSSKCLLRLGCFQILISFSSKQNPMIRNLHNFVQVDCGSVGPNTSDTPMPTLCLAARLEKVLLSSVHETYIVEGEN